MKSQLKNKLRICISIGTVVMLVCSLAFVIYLLLNQHKTVTQLSIAADRMQENIDILFEVDEKRKAKEAEDMKGSD